MRISDGNFGDLVAHRVREWGVRQHIPEQPAAVARQGASTITVSRELGSGGNEVAEAVCARLGWDLWDRQFVEEIARSARVRADIVKSLDEHRRSEVEAVMRELLGDRLQEVGYRRHLAQIILTIAEHGNAVIVGRGANYLLPAALNVRIVAPLAERVERLARREGISADDAERRCIESDRDREAFVRSTFGREIAHCVDYDLVINTGQIPTAGAARIIVAALAERA